MGKDTTQQANLGGSVFWILIILISLLGLVFLMIWSYHNNSVKGVVIGVVFFGMIMSGIILSKFEIFDSGTWSQNSFSFLLGFIIWAFFLGGAQKSILAITQNDLFASIASELPQVLEFTFNSFIIPICEEVFWMIGIPYALASIMNLMGKKYSIFNSKILQLFVIVIVTGVTFALFHVGKMFLAFLIAAFAFRAIMVFSVIGEDAFSLPSYLDSIKLVPAFALGAHIGNNWADYGIMKGVTLLSTNTELSLFIGVFFLIITISAVAQVFIVYKTLRYGRAVKR